MASDPTNDDVARSLERVADLLEVQEASPHRVGAWRAGAVAIAAEPRPVADIFREDGRRGLEAIHHIGAGLASVIIEILKTGRARVLERLEGEVHPTDVLADVPGIGHELAKRIHDALGVESLEELEAAAHDGRLASVEGFGDRRVRAVREILAGRLGQAARRRARPLPAPTPRGPVPPIELLLDLDRRYRELAAAGRLHCIAPRRLNPGRRAWLPILHEEQGGWSFTVLYSNTALAHQLGRTHDWVVIYHERDGVEDRATVVTETRGRLRGRRVVRGREAETPPLPQGALDLRGAPAPDGIMSLDDTARPPRE